MPLNIEKELAQMRRMTVDDLREKFTEVFGQPTQSRHKAWLIKRLAWRMQANDEGGLSQRARQRAAELADETNIRILMPRVVKQASLPAADVVTHRTEVQSPGSGNPLRPGFTLVRQYKGRQILVNVVPDGFEFEGEKYKSLSAVARAVTGKHWNGFHFFKLTKGGDQ